MLEFMDPRPLYQREAIPALNSAEREYLRGLAQRYAQLAAATNPTQTAALWKRHNALHGDRPMVLAFPEGAWRELLPWKEMKITSPFWRGYEWCLRRSLIRAEHIHDDFCLEPMIEVPLVYSISPFIDGVQSMVHTGMEADTSAVHSAEPLQEEEDFELLRPPVLTIDENKTAQNLEAVGDILGDLLTVRPYRYISVNTNLLCSFAEMRGPLNLMYDLYDRPEWVHEVLSYMQKHTLALMDKVEAHWPGSTNTGGSYVGSGGIGYSDELTGRPGWAGCWGFSDAQELSEVSPEMYREFSTSYYRPLLERFGLNCYACCESLSNKIDYVLEDIPNLRRVSVSPWSDKAILAERLGKEYIYSWKPNPALVSGGFDVEAVGADIHETLKLTRNCKLEMILKDTHTVGGDLTRITRWVDMAMERAKAGY